jgi:hypothetical protein
LFEEILKISRMSTLEYINIVGEYNYHVHGSNIDPDIYNRGYSQEAIKIMEQRATPKEIVSCNLKITKPLEDFQFKGFDYVYGLYNHFKSGILPFDGPLSEQPARIIEIFNLFTQLENEAQERARKEQQANGK